MIYYTKITLRHTRSYVMVQAVHLNDSICNANSSVLVPDDALYASVHLQKPERADENGNGFQQGHILCRAKGKSTDLLHVQQERLFVVVPLDRKLTGMWELITGQFYSYFETIRVKVTEVIHTCKAKIKYKNQNIRH